MPDPILTSAAISAGGSILGSLFNDSHDTPDLTSPVRQETVRARRSLAEQADQASNRLNENLAASNAAAVTSSAAREEMFDAQSSARAELENRASEIMADAIRKERMMEFQNQQRRAQNRAEGISSIAQTLGNAAFMSLSGSGGEPGAPNVPQVEPNNAPIEPDIGEFDTSLDLDF